MAYDYKQAVSKLGSLLNRQLGIEKAAEEVKKLGDVETAQNGVGAEQEKELENNGTGVTPNVQTVDSNTTASTPSDPTSVVDDPKLTGPGEGSTPKGVTVNNVPESKQASLANAFARGLVNKVASIQAKAESVDYATGMEMFQKKAAMLQAKTASEAQAAAMDFYANMPRLHANPFFKDILDKHASIKMAEDVAAAMDAGMPGSEEEIAAALQQAVAEDPELAAELEGEVTNDAVDDLAGAEAQAVTVQRIADAAGVPPEAIVEASNLIEEAAAENGMPVEDFVEVLDEALAAEEGAPAEGEVAAEEAPAEAPAEEAPVEGTKEASLRRIAKAASLKAPQDNFRSMVAAFRKH